MALDFVPFDSYIGNLGGGRIDNDSDTFKAVLSNIAPNPATDDELADITQIANGNGYTTGGVTLASVTWTEPSDGVWMFDSADFEWEADGGAMAEFQYVVIYSDTSSGDKLVGYYNFGSGVTIPDGSIFRVQPGVQGHLRIGEGTIA
jgi:hypothetical protein